MKLDHKELKERLYRLKETRYLASDGQLFKTQGTDSDLNHPRGHAEAILDMEYNNLGEEALEQWLDDYEKAEELAEFYIVTDTNNIWRIENFYCQQYNSHGWNDTELSEIRGLVAPDTGWSFATDDLNEAIEFLRFKDIPDENVHLDLEAKQILSQIKGLVEQLDKVLS